MLFRYQKFTTITEKLEPEILTDLITNYLTEMTSKAIKYGGTVDKYIGDAIMIFWGSAVKGYKEMPSLCNHGFRNEKEIEETKKRIGNRLSVLMLEWAFIQMFVPLETLVLLIG